MTVSSRISGVDLTLAFFFVVSAQASAEEVWDCRDMWDAILSDDAPVLLVASINDDGKTGRIEVSGTTHQTEYKVDGLSRDWWWGGNDMDRYLVSIQPDGTTGFYDFGAPPDDETTASAFFKCKKRQGGVDD